MGTQRVLRGAAATLTYVNLDADGVAADAAGAVTVGVTRADGTVLVAAGTATTKPGSTTGIYTVGLTPTQTAQLDLLTATWTVGVLTAAARTTEHLVVGGYMFSIDELRSARTGMDDVATWPTADMIAARAATGHGSIRPRPRSRRGGRSCRRCGSRRGRSPSSRSTHGRARGSIRCSARSAKGGRRTTSARRSR